MISTPIVTAGHKYKRKLEPEVSDDLWARMFMVKRWLKRLPDLWAML
jgi:hypothetical protein